MRMPLPERHRTGQSGAVALIVAVTMSALLVTGAIVLDFGLVRWERQTNKAAADSAAAAGLRAADDGTGKVHNASAICGAYEFLKANRGSLSGLPAGVCATVDTAKLCTAGDTASNYHGTTTVGNRRFEVWIKMPYLVSDTSAGGYFSEESLSSSSGNPGEPLRQGCDQIGVIVKEWTTPGLGSLVTNGELETRIRSVGRFRISEGDQPPALLLLERTRCAVLTVGSAGSPARIKVYGTATMAGSIHADSAASDPGCGSGSGQQLFQGKQADGIVSYGGTAGMAGSITSVATDNGVGANIVSDLLTQVYGTTAVNESSPGTRSAVTARKQVTRAPVDRRYLPGVTTAVQAAHPVWVNGVTNHASPGAPWQRFGCPTPAEMTTMSTMTVADSVFIDCPANGGLTLSGTIGAGTVYFHAFIKNPNLALPNATKVYIDNTDNTGVRIGPTTPALTLSNGTGFCIQATACSSLATGTCTSTTTTAHATLMIRRGPMDSTGGLLRLCNTSVIMESGLLGSGTALDPGGCLPTSNGIAPTATPCPGATTSAGTSHVSLSGETDWTAPNQYGDMTAFGFSDAQKQIAWDAGEDLALWTETYGDGPIYKMAGGGSMHVMGVFMAPNASPFTVTGGGAQDLTDSQFISTRFAVDGGATLTMRADPYNAVTIPGLFDFRLVR